MFDQQNHDDAVARILSSVGTWAVWIIASIASASMSAIKKTREIKVASYHILLNTLVGPGLAVIAVSYGGASMFVGGVVCIGSGLVIFSIATLIENTGKRVENLDLIPAMLRKKGIVTPEEPPSFKEPGK